MSKNLFLAVTVVLGVLGASLNCGYQSLLSQGDHGLDLYAASLAYDGQLPFRDYRWVYGPLMPYYYGLFFQFLGVDISHLLLGKAVLNLASGVFFFLGLAVFIQPLFALLGVFWFWTFQPDFFYTYNHTGGITALMAMTYCLFSYIKFQRPRHLFAGLLCIFLLCLIKLNFGLFAFAGFLLCVYATNRLLPPPPVPEKKRFFYLLLLFLPAVLAIYGGLLYGLSSFEVNDSFPYLKGSQQEYIPVWNGISAWVTSNVGKAFSSPLAFLFNLLVTVSFLQTVNILFSRDTDKQLRKQFALALGAAGLFYVLNLHEFFRSGIFYRSFWALPFGMLFTFLCVGWAVERLGRTLQISVAVAVFFIVGSALRDNAPWTFPKFPERYVAHERGKIYVGNSPEWVHTVLQTSRYLQTQLKDKELFLALPYDPLYYYLTGKKSPARQMIFFEYMQMPPEEERKIIDALEKNNVDYIVLSNRVNFSEESLGALGVTHGRILKGYIDAHFAEAARFGDWEKTPGWISDHATVILKRRP